MRLESAFNRASAENPMRSRRIPNIGVFMAVQCKRQDLHESHAVGSLLAWCDEAGSAMGKCNGVTFVVDWYGPLTEMEMGDLGDSLEWRVIARPASLA